MGSTVDRFVSGFSGSFSAAILVWPLLSLLLSLPILAYLYRRDGWLRLTAVFAVYASVLYGAGLVCFTLYPLPSDPSGPGIAYGIPPILNPLNFIDDIATDGASAVLQLLFNVVLFIPFGFIARTLLKLGGVPTFAASLATTCLIETAQLTGLFGTYPFAFRTFDVDDIICNTLGGVVGWLLGCLAAKWVLDESQEQPPITHSPGFARRCVTFWTDAMIVDICSVVPRIALMAGINLAFGGSSDVLSIPLERINEAISVVCFAVAFIAIEIVIPWRHGGCTLSGMFYRMSCETQVRTGCQHAMFYGLRSVTILLLMLFPKYVALPLCLFYLAARRMPYDFVPSSSGASALQASPSAQ